ncbi:hypothetical protein [Azospirillum palustre]
MRSVGFVLHGACRPGGWRLPAASPPTAAQCLSRFTTLLPVQVAKAARFIAAPGWRPRRGLRYSLTIRAYSRCRIPLSRNRSRASR